MDTNGEVTEVSQAVEKPTEEKPTGTSVPHRKHWREMKEF